jgi:hypothetical protein
VRTLQIRSFPEDPRVRQDVRQLLAAASGLDEVSTGRYLESAGARYRVAASDLVTQRLQEALSDAGVEATLADSEDSGGQWEAWLRTLLRERLTLLLVAAGFGIAAGARGSGTFLFWLVMTSALAAGAFQTFQTRIRLSPAVLARRLGMIPGSVTRPAAALLRPARSPELRAALGGALVEEARLLSAVSRMLGDSPALQAPFRERLDELGQHVLRVAESAAIIEEAGAGDDRELGQRLAQLRALGTAEIDRQLHDLVTTREERQARAEWLRRTHALLVLRLEAISERLRGLRQEAAERALATRRDQGDRPLVALGRELELATAALAEVERTLPQALPEVIAEVVASE